MADTAKRCHVKALTGRSKDKILLSEIGFIFRHSTQSISSHATLLLKTDDEIVPPPLVSRCN